MNFAYRLLFLIVVIGINANAEVITATSKHDTQMNIYLSLFEQKVDHFDPETTKWKQRFYRSYDFYKKGGSVFLLLTTSLKRGLKWMRDGQLRKYAKDYKAVLLTLEHRFYGPSGPTTDLSFDNLELLSTDQAIADVIYFVEKMTLNMGIKIDTKWILFGGGYSGSVMAASRALNPDSVYASIVSSAPMETKFNHMDYYSTLGRSINKYTKQCAKRLQLAINELRKLSKDNTTLVDIKNKFKLSFDIEKTDVPFLAFQLAERLSSVAGRNKMYKSDGTIRKKSVPYLCDVMTGKEHLKTGNSSLDQLAYFNNENYNSTRIQNQRNYIKALANTKFSDYSGDRAWLYQSCTENGRFATSVRLSQMFLNYFPVDFFVNLCQKVFDKSLTLKFMEDRIAVTNRLFNAVKKKAKRILFVNGSLDPLKGLGIQKADPYKNYDFVIIKGGHQCWDFPKTNEYTPKSVLDAHEKINSTLSSWLT